MHASEDMGESSDQRRARMGDVLRLQAAVESLTDKVADLQAQQAAGRMLWPNFLAQYIMAATVAGVKSKYVAQHANDAWVAYNAILDGTASPAISPEPSRAREDAVPLAPQISLASPAALPVA